MGKINYGRVILGGVVAGTISFILWWFFNGVLLFQRWVDTTKALRKRSDHRPAPGADEYSRSHIERTSWRIISGNAVII